MVWMGTGDVKSLSFPHLSHSSPVSRGGGIYARRILGDLQLGVSCYDSRDLAMQAGEAGASGTV